MNWIPIWIPNDHTRGLPNNYWETNEYCTEAAYRDGDRDSNPERTEAIIRMTFTENRPTDTQQNAESRDAEICKCDVQWGFPRGEPRS